MFEVYRLLKIPRKGNNYGINRDETWSFEKDLEFDSLKDAQDYVISKNKKLCGSALNILFETDNQVIKSKCLDNKYCHLQEYFIGKPDIQPIIKNLDEMGIKVVN